MSLQDQVIDCWDKDEDKIHKMLSNWIEYFNKNNELRKQTKRFFHNWSPLMTYVSIGKAGHIFSLRFLGQEVGEIVVEGRIPYLVVNKKKEKINLSYFKGGSIKNGKCLWNSQEAQGFRKFFKNLHNPENTIKFHSPEHIIESRIIAEMKKGSSNKFGGSLRKIQPVMIEGKFPLQMPVPFGGCGTTPKFGNGHIDILARRGVGRNTFLSVWELKKPKIVGSALQQAYIYAVTLILMLRSDKGQEWYKIFGFNRKLPKHLKIECVVAISEGTKSEFEEKFNEIKKDMPTKMGSDTIKFSVAYYDETKKPITIKEFKECN